MKPSSAKQKGRRLQHEVAARLLDLLAPFGCTKDDIVSRPMGSPGADIMLSSRAKQLLGPLDVECKNVERPSLRTAWAQALARDAGETTPCLVHSWNRNPDPLVTIPLTQYLVLLGDAIRHRHPL